MVYNNRLDALHGIDLVDGILALIGQGILLSNMLSVVIFLSVMLSTCGDNEKRRLAAPFAERWDDNADVDSMLLSAIQAAFACSIGTSLRLCLLSRLLKRQEPRLSITPSQA